MNVSLNEILIMIDKDYVVTFSIDSIFINIK